MIGAADRARPAGAEVGVDPAEARSLAVNRVVAESSVAGAHRGTGTGAMGTARLVDPGHPDLLRSPAGLPV